MIMAPRIMLEADLNARAAYLAATYAANLTSTQPIAPLLAPLRRLRGHAVVDGWENLLAAGDLVGFARTIVSEHYDPAYTKARASQDFTLLGTVRAAQLDGAGLDQAAQDVADCLTAAE